MEFRLELSHLRTTTVWVNQCYINDSSVEQIYDLFHGYIEGQSRIQLPRLWRETLERPWCGKFIVAGTSVLTSGNRGSIYMRLQSPKSKRGHAIACKRTSKLYSHVAPVGDARRRIQKILGVKQKKKKKIGVILFGNPCHSFEHSRSACSV